jgi:hypothetical protein
LAYRSDSRPETTFSERDGPQGRPIARLPEEKWFLRTKKSQRERNTEYAGNFCHEHPGKQLNEVCEARSCVYIEQNQVCRVSECAVFCYVVCLFVPLEFVLTPSMLQMLDMTFNDNRIRRETKVDISTFLRSELRTGMRIVSRFYNAK